MVVETLSRHSKTDPRVTFPPKVITVKTNPPRLAMQLPLLWRRQMLPIEGRQRASVEHSSPHQKTGWTVGVDKVSWVRIPLHKHII